MCCHSHRTQAPLVQWARYPEFANPACMISKSSLEHWPEILKRSFSHAFISKAPGGPGRTSRISHFPIRELQRYTGEFFPSVRYGVAEWRSTRTPIRAQFLRDPHPPIQCWSRLPGLALGFSFPTLGGGVGGHVSESVKLYCHDCSSVQICVIFETEIWIFFDPIALHLSFPGVSLHLST